METTFSFTINWHEVLKAAGYIAIGIGIVIMLILWLFRDFKPYR